MLTPRGNGVTIVDVWGTFGRNGSLALWPVLGGVSGLSVGSPKLGTSGQLISQLASHTLAPESIQDVKDDGGFTSTSCSNVVLARMVFSAGREAPASTSIPQ